MSRTDNWYHWWRICEYVCTGPIWLTVFIQIPFNLLGALATMLSGRSLSYYNFYPMCYGMILTLGLVCILECVYKRHLKRLQQILDELEDSNFGVTPIINCKEWFLNATSEQLTFNLHRSIDQYGNDSVEADSLREQLEKIWYKLSDKQIELCTDLSAHLNQIRDSKDRLSLNSESTGYFLEQETALTMCDDEPVICKYRILTMKQKEE